jgi:sugar lactone lactonase YvrE
MRLAAALLAAALPASAQDAPPFATFDRASASVLNDPHDLTFGPDGRLYVADKLAGRIAVFDPETLDLVEVLGEGLLPQVRDISFGPQGQAVLAVTGASAVAVWADPARIGEAPDLVLSAPQTEGALAHSNGRIYAAAAGVGALLAYEGTELLATAQGLSGAHDVEEAPDGTVWVADTGNARLVQYDADLTQLAVIDAPRFGLVGPRYLAFTEDGLLAVADQDAHRVLLIDPAGAEGGTLLGVLGDGLPGIGPGKFDDPEGLVARGARFWIADSDNNRIVRYAVVLN